MTVKELITKLKRINNQNSKINLVINDCVYDIKRINLVVDTNDFFGFVDTVEFVAKDKE